MTLKPGAKSSPKLNIDWLKSQTKKVQKEVLETLTTLSEPEAQALIWSWSFWARQDQLPPPGHWTGWMMLGVTACVLDNLTGTTSWHLGRAADKKKFANTARWRATQL